ncbi:MAG: PEP-CTERM sorting domain-containing protein [Pirellulales bacterium]
MRSAKPRTAAIIALLILVWGVAPAGAAPLAPGGLLFPAPLEAQPTGGVVIASSIQPIVAPTYTANLVTTVIQGDTSNLLGGLTFTYEIQGVAGTESINRLSILGYDNILVDASYRLPAPGAIPPAFYDREMPGDALGISFAGPPIGPGPVQPGQSSATLVFQTNAPAHVPAQAFLIDGATTGVITFAPIPEPATLTLCGMGALGLALAYRRRRAKS